MVSIKCIWITPTKENGLFKLSILGYLVILIITKAEAFCGERTNLSATEGRLVVLRPVVAETEELSIIYWIRDDATEIAAIRYLNETSDIQNNQNGEKFNISLDGSLTVKNFTVKDQGFYIVVIKRVNQSDCTHMYYVNISVVTPKSANTKKVYVYSHEEQKLTLPLPEHLTNQTEDIFWMKNHAKHIATTFKNGSLDILVSSYQGRLQSTEDGSLIILHLRVEDRGQYSADIHLTNKELFTEIYHVGVYRKSYYLSLGTWEVSATEGGDLIFQIGSKEIEAIDWLTRRWIRFAATKQGGNIFIFDQSYSNRLSSLSDGSITIKTVTKKDEGIYRAQMFSHNGMVLEQKFLVRIHDNHRELYIYIYMVGVVGVLALVILLTVCYCWVILRRRMKEMPKHQEKPRFVIETEIWKKDFEKTRPQQCDIGLILKSDNICAI